MNNMRVKQTTHIIYYIILTTHIYAYIPTRVNGGVSHRSRRFLGLFFHIKEKMKFIVFISIFLFAICQQQNTSCITKSVWRVNLQRKFIQ